MNTGFENANTVGMNGLAGGEKISQVNHQLNALEKALHQNEELHGELIKRLNPVLRMIPAQPATPEGQIPKESVVALAERIRDSVQFIERGNVAMRQVLGQLEL